MKRRTNNCDPRSRALIANADTEGGFREQGAKGRFTELASVGALTSDSALY